MVYFENVFYDPRDPQGQVGADIVFTTQQLALRQADSVYRSTYMDDLNDFPLHAETDQDAVLAVQANERVLDTQAQQIGIKKNHDKTTYIPINVCETNMVNLGLDAKNITRKS